MKVFLDRYHKLWKLELLLFCLLFVFLAVSCNESSEDDTDEEDIEVFDCDEQIIRFDNGKEMVVQKSKPNDIERLRLLIDGKCVLDGPYRINQKYLITGHFVCWNYKDGLFALFDSNGNEIIPFSRGYQNIGQLRFPAGIFYKFYLKANGQMGLCDESGEEIISPRYYLVRPFFTGDSPGLIEDDNNYFDVRCIMLRSDYSGRGTDYVYSLDKREIIAAFGGHEGIRDFTGEAAILNARYIKFGKSNDGNWNCQYLHGIYDLYFGREVVPCKFCEVYCNENNYIKVYNENKEQAYYDLEGNLLLPMGDYGSDFFEKSTNRLRLEKYDYYGNDCVRYVTIPHFKPRDYTSTSGGSSGGGSVSIPSQGGGIYIPPTNVTKVSKEEEEMYRRQYREYGESVQDDIRTLQIIKEGNPTYTSLAIQKDNIRSCQNSMKQTREEAARKGIYIEQSPLETTTNY